MYVCVIVKDRGKVGEDKEKAKLEKVSQKNNMESVLPKKTSWLFLNTL